MPLTIGARLGPYEIVGALGAGGMGEVWRARDTKLGREVALKALPDAFATDAERLARFEREARLLASLNHPGIGAIYGFEQFKGTQVLVLELVEGETLADRLVRGAIPLEEALRLALQMADALEAAHEQGIIHRDFKPANIKIRRDGAVKILDFGLAKAFDPVPGDSPSVSQSPTIVSPEATVHGVILGTAAYMSPEQARGTAIDKRTDIWAFGCVMYEILTRRRAFPGDTVVDAITTILTREPDWRALPDGVPQSVQRLIRRCLDKDPRSRLRDIGDARYELAEAVSAVASPSSVAGAGRVHPDGTQTGASLRRTAPRMAAGLALLIAGLAVGWYFSIGPDSFRQNPFERATFTRLTDFEGAEQNAAISRDGRFVAFVSERGGTWDAWVGQIGTGEFQNLTRGGVPELRNPAVRNVSFSPDSSRVTLEVRLPSGSIETWTAPTLGGQLRPFLAGAEPNWNADGSRVVYHASTEGDALFVTEPGETTGRQISVGTPGIHNHFPVWSPDGAFIYFVRGVPPDELDIWRIPPAAGEPERITQHGSHVAFPTFLDDRTLIYVATAEDRTGPWLYALDVVDRTSRRLSTGVEAFTSVAASADGRRLVATVARSTASLWRMPLADRPVDESGVERIALPTARALSPRLAPDLLIFRSPKGGTDAIWKVENGNAVELWSGLEGRVVASPAIAPDAQRLVFSIRREGGTRLYLLNVNGTGLLPLAEGLDVRGAPAWSPDGQWIAVAADRGQGPQLFKIPVSGGAATMLVEEYSTDPVWSPDGRFLLYSGADVGTTFPVKGVAADGAPYTIPDLTLDRGARRLAFMPDGEAVVILRGNLSRKDFWLFDLTAARERQLTALDPGFTIGDFDIAADGREIVFDRLKEESDIVLIDVPDDVE
jgi:Tol biopolymer transport system component